VLFLTTKIVFDAYSYYVMRRSIDAEFEAKKIPSLEYLNVLQQRERGLLNETFETRCTERIEIALYRVINVLKETRLQDYYKQTMSAKDSLVAEIEENGPKFLEDWQKAVAYVNSATFRVAEFNGRYLKKPSTVDETDQAYKDFMVQVRKHLNSYNDLVLSNPDLQKLAQEVEEETRQHWHQEAVIALEERLKRLKADRASRQQELKNTNVDEIWARYEVWTNALSGRLPLLDEMEREIDQIEKGGQTALAETNCQLPDRTLRTGGNLGAMMTWYHDQLLTYFNQPPAAQTLIVTLFMGGLGGLTVNTLRLSQLGWWRGRADPLWGEIIVSPMLGALAALAIYLVGSAGLLLTSDFRAAQNGASPLSASFIGLLGFLSGFLYDTAFGRVRRVGVQLFAGDTAVAPNASADDRSLAEGLKGANASLVAGLLLTRGIGSKLASESEFTLLAPSDRAVGQKTLAAWNEITDTTANAFDAWYKRHHAGKRVMKKDLAGPPASPIELKLDDGATVELRVEGDELKVGTTKAIVADVVWKKGVIHVMQDELA
jgi:hypothetical protein